MTNTASTILEKTKAKTVRHGECELWQGTTSPFGYGVVRYQGKRMRLHRLIYTLIKGEIPEGMVVMHQCDTPACINPNHLHLGTATANTQDMHMKGRAPNHKGRNNGMAKLTDDQVLAIRARHQYYSRTNGASAISRDYGVSSVSIDGIVRRLTWTHLP